MTFAWGALPLLQHTLSLDRSQSRRSKCNGTQASSETKVQNKEDKKNSDRHNSFPRHCKDSLDTYKAKYVSNNNLLQDMYKST